MAESLRINRAHLVLLVCLPLAILLGYLLANPDPLTLNNLALVGLVFLILCSPILIKWYHPILVFSCNSVFMFTFLPGNPTMWMLAAFMGFFFAVINRCVDSNRRLMVGGPIARSLLLLSAIVFVTAYIRGGAGVAALGSSSYGGKRYFYIALAVMAYFALASYRVPSNLRGLYMALFFLSGATGILTLLVNFGGPQFAILGMIAPSSFGTDVEFSFSNVRLFGLGGVCSAVLLYMLVKWGLQGMIDRFWRTALALLMVAGLLLSGFRSAFGFLLLVFVIAFFLEGLHRTRYLWIGGGLAVGCLSVMLLISEHLPWQMQRAISFLPVRVSPMVKQDAQSSLDWRFAMWRAVWPEVPQYFWKGKGYAMDPGDMYMSRLNSVTQFGSDSSEWAVYAGDYHNGPLSIIIPFGIWGMIAFIWFLAAVWKMLYYNYLHSEPDLKRINGIFLTYFTAKVFFFFFLVGGFHGDLIFFTSLAGLSISLNGDRVRQVEREVSPYMTLATQRIAKDL